MGCSATSQLPAFDGEIELAFQGAWFRQTLSKLLDHARKTVRVGLRTPLVAISYAGDPQVAQATALLRRIRTVRPPVGCPSHGVHHEARPAAPASALARIAGLRRRLNPVHTVKYCRTRSSFQIGNRSGGHRSALVDDTKLLGDPTGERQLLLDQQHGHPQLPIQAPHRHIDLLNDGGLLAGSVDLFLIQPTDNPANFRTTLGWIPSVGSSRISRRGSSTKARPMASCCCCPPDRSPPRQFHGRAPGTVRRSIPAPVVNAGIGPKPIFRFSSTVSSGKICRPCGT